MRQAAGNAFWWFLVVLLAAIIGLLLLAERRPQGVEEWPSTPFETPSRLLAIAR